MFLKIGVSFMTRLQVRTFQGCALKNSGHRKDRSNNERVGQESQHDADNGKDQAGHRIGVSLAQLVRGATEADQAYHASNQRAGRDRDGSDVVDRSLERGGYGSLSLEQ